MRSAAAQMISVLSLASLVAVATGCYGDDAAPVASQVSSRSYQGHEDDRDANNLVAAYPQLVGTRLDDCQTCHGGRTEEGRQVGNACDRCHDLLLHGDGSGGEHAAAETLNAFGRDYLAAGRSLEALESIGSKDSDGDGFTNDEELRDARYPGSGRSMPGQAVAHLLTVPLAELRALPAHRQLMLSNTSKQKYDDYVDYTGVTLVDLLASRGVDLAGATGITVIAPDGYMKSLPVEQIELVFPQARFHAGLDLESLGPDCGFVRYPDEFPAGLVDGAPLPGEHRLMLAYARDGEPLDPARLDVTDGRIEGEGPLRLVVPQTSPGRPDRGARLSPTDCGDGLDYRPDADHNAGAMVRGVVAVRIDPMPAGVEEFDYMNGGWAYVDSGELILYGHGID